MKLEHYEAIEALKVAADDIIKHRYIKKKTRELIYEKIVLDDSDPEETFDRINMRLAKMHKEEFLKNMSFAVGSYYIGFNFGTRIILGFDSVSRSIIRLTSYCSDYVNHNTVMTSIKIPKSLDDMIITYENLE